MARLLEFISSLVLLAPSAEAACNQINKPINGDYTQINSNVGLNEEGCILQLHCNIGYHSGYNTVAYCLANGTWIPTNTFSCNKQTPDTSMAVSCSSTWRDVISVIMSVLPMYVAVCLLMAVIILCFCNRCLKRDETRTSNTDEQNDNALNNFDEVNSDRCNISLTDNHRIIELQHINHTDTEEERYVVCVEDRAAMSDLKPESSNYETMEEERQTEHDYQSMEIDLDTYS